MSANGMTLVTCKVVVAVLLVLVAVSVLLSFT